MLKLNQNKQINRTISSMGANGGFAKKEKEDKKKNENHSGRLAEVIVKDFGTVR